MFTQILGVGNVSDKLLNMSCPEESVYTLYSIVLGQEYCSIGEEEEAGCQHRQSEVGGWEEDWGPPTELKDDRMENSIIGRRIVHNLL